ncbi:MAG: NTP transferase domain-containing protein [Henriciella sp.]
MTGEHASDVLAHLHGWLENGDDAALVIVTKTEGGAVRAPGALLAVSGTNSIGYISGGCIDADVKLQALRACEDRAPKTLRYGAGSPFVDLPLPCGGAIEVTIVPNPSLELISKAVVSLSQRFTFSMTVSADGALTFGGKHSRLSQDTQTFFYAPKLRLRIAGRGTDTIALARISAAAGYSVRLQLVDDEDVAEASGIAGVTIEKLETPKNINDPGDDAWTAFVLLFHDRTWEVPLLQQAINGSAFYIGAVGSKRTHALRSQALLDAGCRAHDIEKIHGPIGLVPSLRDASMLAISTLAEIVERFPSKLKATLPNTAVLLLAAGSSSRYEDGDKLLAKLGDRLVLEHSSAGAVMPSIAKRLAVIAPDQASRKDLLEQYGWDILDNEKAPQGQSTTLVLGIETLEQCEEIDQVIILLADMPNISDSHLEAMIQLAGDPDVEAVMSECDGVLSPPALFKRTQFQALSNLSGDRGAKSAFLAMEGSAKTITLLPEHAADVDHVADLNRLKEVVNA